MISRYRYLIWLGWRKVVQRPILSILLLLGSIYIGATLVITAYEKVGFGHATMEIFPAFFGEVGIIESPFLPVRVCVIIGLVASISFLAIVTAKITSVLVESIRRGGSMAKRVNFSGHTIICGWNFQGERIVKELQSATTKQQRGIVILHDSEERPIKDERVEFIRGDPSQDENLIRAGLMRADVVHKLPEKDRVIVVNPQSQYSIRQGDALFIISESEPAKL